MIPSPKNLNNDALKHFTDRPNTADISPEPDSIPLEPPSRKDVNELYRRIWIANSDILKAYDYGSNVGTVKISNNTSLNDILYSLTNALKQIISNEITKAGGSTEGYKPIYEALNNIFVILQDKFSSQTNKDKKADSMAILAGLHGFICAYVNSVKNVK